MVNESGPVVPPSPGFIIIFIERSFITMAKTIVRKRNAKTSKKTFASPFNIYWEKKNYFFFYLGFILLIVGFYLMSVGKWNSTASLVFSPIILVIAYVFIFPAAIWYRNKTKEGQEQKGDTSQG